MGYVSNFSHSFGGFEQRSEKLDSDPNFPHFSLAMRFASLALAAWDLTQLRQVCDRWRVPNECRELAEVVLREHGHVRASAALDAAGVLQLLERCDAIRKPARFDQVLQVCAPDARSRLRRALDLALSVNTAAVAAQAQADGLGGAAVGERIHAARVAAIDHGLGESG